MGAYALLHDRCAPIWSSAAAHPMVQAIGDGSLPHKTFRYYFEQNILYLQNYARAISLVLAKAPDAEAIDLLGQFVRGESERELPMNYDFLHRLGGDPHATDYTEMSAANHAYSQHMLATTSLGDCAEGLAALLPCPCSYNEITKVMATKKPDDPIYAEWISKFAENPDDDAFLRSLEALLDRLVDPADEQKMRRLDWIFRTSSHYEIMFWDAAFAGPDADPFRG